ncbi:MAG: glycine cleavage system aminomethyltransferase GcvT [Bdellovibrionaceae bacterium]|nr:glycine cleavage system aminomethyltransferase GcvT [Pseudobdellovibrionaceae bacterium]
MKKTILFESHKIQKAKFISFAGWQMPFSYSSPAQEHYHVRKTGGIFDVSHMGQIRIKGKDSRIFLEKLLPSNLENLYPGKAIYSVLCLHTGGLIDDLILYSYSAEDYLLCVNSAFKDKDLEWIKSQHKKENLWIQDESEKWGLIAIQGPCCFKFCEKIFPTVKFNKIKKFHFIEQDSCLFARTGYTGEDGFEVYIPREKALPIWNKMIIEGREFSILPIGLGARDTLRLEMAYLLSGQDFDESKTPLQAGISWLLKNPKNYIGKDAILKQKEQGDYSKLQAFVMEEAISVPRTGYAVYSETGKKIGEVTSGAKSPSLDKMIGLAYIKGNNENCWIDIRGSKMKANIVSKPFLKR